MGLLRGIVVSVAALSSRERGFDYRGAHSTHRSLGSASGRPKRFYDPFSEGYLEVTFDPYLKLKTQVYRPFIPLKICQQEGGINQSIIIWYIQQMY